MEKEIEEKIATQVRENHKLEQISKELLTYYEPLYRAVQKLGMDYSLILFVKGRAGTGKSHNIELALEQNNMEYIEAHKVTEAYLPQLLFENKDKVIWFKDVMKIFNNPMMIAMIKACGEMRRDKEGRYLPRLVTILNYSNDLKKAGVPKRFHFSGKLLFDYNEIVTLRYLEDFNALISRGDYLELVFDFDEMSQIMKLIANNDTENMITDYLIENFEFFGQQFNLRTQQKAFDTHGFCNDVNLDWRTILKDELSRNKSQIQSMLYQFLGKNRLKSQVLKKMLVQSGYCGTLRTADRKVKDWIEMEELFKVSTQDRNFFVSLLADNNDTLAS